MIKKLIITSAVTVFALANTSTQIDNKSINENIDKLIKAISKKTKAEVVVKDKKVTDNSQSFNLVFKDKKTDKISAHSKKSSKSIDGLSFSNNIEYTKDAFKGTTVLTSFPTKAKGKKIIMDKIIKDKIVTLNYDYNIKDFKYNVSLKDINDTFDKGHIVTKNIKLSGIYDTNNILAQESNFSIGKIKILPTNKKLAGQYVDVENILISSSYSSTTDGNIDIKYNTSVSSAGYNISHKNSSVKNFKFNGTIGNLNKVTYLKINDIFQSNPMIKITDPKLMELVTKLLTTPNLFIAIDELSVDSLKVLSQDLGSAKISLKLSLENNPKLLDMIKVSPLMAIGALNVDANIELSQEIYNMLLLSPKGMMLAMVPVTKNKKGMIVYDISFKKGKLLINGQQFPPKRKKH